jgi:hypothetical protein
MMSEKYQAREIWAGCWQVLHHVGIDGWPVATFHRADAEQCAKEYARWKNIQAATPTPDERLDPKRYYAAYNPYGRRWEATSNIVGYLDPQGPHTCDDAEETARVRNLYYMPPKTASTEPPKPALDSRLEKLEVLHVAQSNLLAKQNERIEKLEKQSTEAFARIDGVFRALTGRCDRIVNVACGQAADIKELKKMAGNHTSVLSDAVRFFELFFPGWWLDIIKKA